MFKNLIPRHAAWWGITLLLLSSGCVTRQDIQGIQTDLYNIQKSVEGRLGNVTEQTESVQTSQADLLQEIRDLNANLSVVKTELMDYQQRMSQMSGRMDDVEASLSARMDAQIELLSGSKFVEKPLPSTVFNLANTDFSRGRYTEAIKGFESYLKQFPKGDKVAEARLKIGDSHARLKDSATAISSYDELLADFPKHALAPAALLRKGMAYENMGKSSQAKEIYTQLIKTYPYAVEAKTAQDQMRALLNENNAQ